MGFYDNYNCDPTLIITDEIKETLSKYTGYFRRLTIKAYSKGKWVHCGIYYILLNISSNVTEVNSDAIAFVVELLFHRNYICPPMDGFDVKPILEKPKDVWDRSEIELWEVLKRFLNEDCFGINEETTPNLESGECNPIEEVRAYNPSFKNFIKFCSGSAHISHYTQHP